MNTVTGLSNLPALGVQSKMQAHGDNTAKYVAQLSSGKRINSAKDDSSGAAIAAQMQSNVSVMTQTKLNASNASSLLAVATGALGDQKDLLISMKTLATASLDASLSSTNRAMVNNEFVQLRDQVGDVADRARWNGVSLMTGGAGTATNAGVVAAAATGVVAAGTANTLGANAANITGNVSGIATEAVVTNASATSYDVRVKVGEQWFEARNVTPANNGTIDLVSTVDSGTSFQLNFAADASGVTDAAVFQTALGETLGLTGAGANANFVASSVAPANGLTGFTPASTAEAGTYAFRYDAGSNQLTLSNGSQKWTQEVATTGAAQSLTFANGITVNLDNTFVVGTSIAQTVFDVARTDEVALNFQVAEQATDLLSVQISGTTLSALGLSGASVDTTANATLASAAIDNALDVVNSAYSNLGAQQKRLDSVQSNLDTTIENLTAAKSAVEDADIASAMTNYTVANTMAQVSNVALSQSLQMTQQLLSIVRS